jgi:alkaline phosphatase
MKKKGLNLSLIFVVCALFITTSCDYQGYEVDYKDGETKQINVYKTPKYIFYFIGDGMSTPQINVTEAAVYDKEFTLKSTSDVGLGELNIQKFPVIGMQTTHAEDRYITGSAASATALACGYKTSIGTIGMNSEHSESFKTMAEMAKDKGMKVGIISSVSIDHATPACFYAHTENRNNYYTIGQQLTKSGFDYFGGGGVRWNKYSGEGQPKNINVFIDSAIANGYSYVDTRSEFEALNPESGKVIATLEQFRTNTSDACALPYVLDLDEQTSEDNTITLSEFTSKGIELLYDSVGFFMMVEGGKIDWACHANDVVTAAHNTVEFDKAIGVALEFYNAHPDETLIIITGDHECGGLTLGYSATNYETAFQKLNHQRVSFTSFTGTVDSMRKNNVNFNVAMEIAQDAFGIGDTTLDLGLSTYETNLLKDAYIRSMLGISHHDDEEIKVIYGYYDPFTVTLTHILNNKAGIDWTSYSHTGVPVPVFAKGQGQHEFNGYYDNTDIAKRIIDIAKLNQ